MVLGVAVAASNLLDAVQPTKSTEGIWVKWNKDEPSCKGYGKTCFDFTIPSKPKPE